MVTVECSPQAQMARDVGGKIMGLLCSFPSIGQGLDPAQMFMELLVTAHAAVQVLLVPGWPVRGDTCSMAVPAGELHPVGIPPPGMRWMHFAESQRRCVRKWWWGRVGCKRCAARGENLPLIC